MVVERRAHLVCGPGRGSLAPNRPLEPTAGGNSVARMNQASTRRGSAARRLDQQSREVYRASNHDQEVRPEVARNLQ